MRLAAMTALLTLGLLAAAMPAAAAAPPAVADIATAPAAAHEPRTVLPLDPGWRFQRGDISGGETAELDDSGWQRVALPHSYNAEDGLDVQPYRGPAWYRRTVTLEAPAPGRRIYIEFDGAALAADVWINGIHAGRHEGGYARFRFDITPCLRAGANLIAVRVDNAKQLPIAPLGGDFTVFGGLYRSARLVSTQDIHLDMQDYGSSGVVFRAAGVTAKSAALSWTARLANDRDRAAPVKLTIRLYDARHRVVATTSKRLTLPPHAATSASLAAALDAPHLWQGVADPYLYTSEIELQTGAAKPQPLDRLAIPVGIRDIRIDADRGLTLNGRPYRVHGVDIHQTMLPGKGPAVSESDIDADFKLLEELGVTGLRFAHYQHPQRDYDLADRAGYLVWTEVPLVAAVDAAVPFQDNIAQQLRELIRQNINHPSVYVWGLGNEITHVDDASARTLDALQALARQEDPARPTTYANCCSEIDGPQASHTDLIASNIYFGWYNGEFADFGPWMDTNHVRRPHTPEAISEYGAGASPLQQEDPPRRPKTDGHWHPEQYQALYHESAWRDIEARPWLWASYIWVGFDFPSAGRDEGDSRGINDKGLVSFDRQTRKDAYYWYQANWSAKPMLHIASPRHTPRKSAAAEVKIYTNQPEASLRVNGIDHGTQTVAGHIARWQVTLEPGSNRIEAAAGATGDTVEWIYASED